RSTLQDEGEGRTALADIEGGPSGACRAFEIRHHPPEADQMVPERELEPERVCGIGMQELLVPAFETQFEGRPEPAGTKELERQVGKPGLEAHEADLRVDVLIADAILHAAADLEREDLGTLGEGLVGLKSGRDAGDAAQTKQGDESGPCLRPCPNAARPS